MKEKQKYFDPPKRADRFFNWYCHKPLREAISGDLYERYIDNIITYGQKKANRKYWFDVIRFMNRHTLKRSGQSKIQRNNQLIMLSNYLKVGFRNLLKNKSFTLINVLSLSVSMAVCLVIILMINDQFSYDNFQANRDRIYRVVYKDLESNDLPSAMAPLPLADLLQSDSPGIEHLVRLRRNFKGELIQNGKAINISGLFTEPSFFDVFSFELDEGDKKTCLETPNSVVLRKDIAEKLFKDRSPIGQNLEVEGLGSFIVTGVLKDFPHKTHIDFEVLASLSSVPNLEKNQRLWSATGNWQNTESSWLYFTLFDGVDPASLQPLLIRAAKENYDPDDKFFPEFNTQKMTSITPGPIYSNQIGSSMPNFFSYGLGILAVLIISCAAFNYTNLSAARALTRTKEVGVRKVMGAKRMHLIAQFIIESILVSIFALIVAIGLLQFLIPAFENLQLSRLLNWELRPSARVYFQFFLFSILIGFVTGIFPSIYLSSFRPIQAIKSMIGSNKLSKLSLRKVLIVAQFSISLVLIISSVLVQKQLKYMIEKDYGYTKENIINIDLQGQSFDILKNELEKLSQVQQISGASHIPNTGNFHHTGARRNQTDEPITFNRFSVDHTYIKNLDLTLIAGNDFLPSQKNGNSIIVNETGVKSLGYDNPSDIIGQPVILGDSTKVNVVGVVKDYHFAILYLDISPLYLRYQPERFRWAHVKTSGQDIFEEIRQLEKVWDKFDPHHDFEYKTFQGHVDEFNAYFYDILYIVGLIAILSISIAGMGLLGIATYSIQIRLKEISIRKVLGASISGLIMLLSKNFLKLLFIALVLALSIAYLGNSAWLNEFAYRVSFGVDIFLIAALSMIGVGVLTIGIQAFKATSKNPANNLRDD